VGRHALVVADAADPLARIVSGALALRQFTVRDVEAGQLALLPLVLFSERVRVDGHFLDAVAFFTDPTTSFSADFAGEDRDFCDAEVRATWLAIVNSPAVATVTRWRPEEWSSLGEWAVWRRRMIDHGVCVSPMSFGENGDTSVDATWFPFSSGTAHRIPGLFGRRSLAPAVSGARLAASSIYCCGEIVAGPDTPHVRSAVAVLEQYGTRLAAIMLDEQGRVLMCTSRPAIPEGSVACLVAEKIAEYLDAAVSHR
jgi:hypothetical protein